MAVSAFFIVTEHYGCKR